MTLSTIEQALEDLKAGKPILVADAANRENEGDAIMAAEFANEKWIAWMINNTSGYLCAPMPSSRANLLGLPLMVPNNQDRLKTQYTVSVDAATGVTTGISAADRARTLNVLADPNSTAADLVRPGHVIPLRSNAGGTRFRPGHTEATVDLLKLAGLSPVGVIGEMVNKDGTMMRMPQLEEVAERDDLKLITTEQIVAHLEQSNIHRSDPNSDRVTFETEAIVPTTHGTFRMRGYNDNFTNADHVAIVAGFPTGHDVLVRIHSECITGEAFGSLKCECGPQLDYALDEIAASPDGGVVLYLRGQEGRGIGLINKFKAYALQQTGLDTVDANLALGLPSENREYGAAIAMLRDLGIESVRLMTNNPAKGDSLIAAGIQVTEYVPVIVGIAAQNAGYLETKRDRMGHMIPSEV